MVNHQWSMENQEGYNFAAAKDPPGWHRGIELAPWHLRAVAYLVDHSWIFLFAAYLPFGFSDWFWFWSWWTAAVFWGFNVFMTYTTGQSAGKRAMGIRLYRVRYDPHTGKLHYVTPGWSALFREILHLVDFGFFGLGMLWPLWDEKRQTFADKFGTIFCAKNHRDVIPVPNRFGWTTVE